MWYVFVSGRVGGIGGEWMIGLGLGFTNPGGTGGEWDMCVFWLRWCWGGGCVAGLSQGLGEWGVLSLCLL